MEEIVTALLKLCQEATSGEVFLLASAALANITFFDAMACEMLLQLDAVKILIGACCDKQKVDSPYSRDQKDSISTVTLGSAVRDADHQEGRAFTFEKKSSLNMGAVTILANISVLDRCASEIIQGNGVQVLMEMLFEKSSSGNPAEVAACERVQQKAAVTLARLSRDPEVAHIATNLNCKNFNA
ncbi:hypothetical protein JD844_021827 [Phrynosoma platyrhinos]|uniref:Protein inscuteable homologue C-terminal domain-containing protein n=1 Tax=Phrynosoma platyrhinos TaxID=52577 RepID=A0ABQ7SU79_PHRPL|nr:hypothetical protein JD844_021827 [Phrynosoma platyrhinos]